MNLHNRHHLAFVIPSFGRGGAERVVSRLSRWFHHRGLEVAVITWEGQSPAYDFYGQIFDLNLPPAPLLLKPIRQSQRTSALRELLKSLQPQQVVGFMEAANVPVIRAARGLKNPPHVTVSIRDAPDSFRGLQRLCMQYWYPLADRIVVLTHAGKNDFVHKWRLPSEKCVVIPNPLDDLFFHPSPPTHAAARSRLGLAVGRLTHQKGFDWLIQAWREYCSDLSAKMQIYGDGPWYNKLKNMISCYHLESQIELAGTTRDIVKVMDQARLFVLSSRHEGFPNVLAEAMARGCACVAFDCPTGPNEMIEHERTGILVPFGDIRGLGQAIRRVLLDDALAERLGEAARQRAQEWAIDRIAPQWLVH